MRAATSTTPTLQTLPTDALLKILAHLSAVEIRHLQRALPSPPFLHVTRDAQLWRALITRDFPGPLARVGARLYIVGGVLDWQRVYEEARRRDRVVKQARLRGGRPPDDAPLRRSAPPVGRVGNVHRFVAGRGDARVVWDERRRLARFDWSSQGV